MHMVNIEYLLTTVAQNIH